MKVEFVPEPHSVPQWQAWILRDEGEGKERKGKERQADEVRKEEIRQPDTKEKRLLTRK